MSWAQERDTTAVADVQADDRNVMLDASASAKPRDIPIGLPGEAGGTMIMEDGMPVASTWSPIYPYVHWAGGSSYAEVGLMGIEETALRSGVLGFSVNSHTALGSDKLHVWGISNGNSATDVITNWSFFTDNRVLSL